MTLRIASAEIVSILFMLIILCSSVRKEERKTAGHAFFLALIISTTLGLGVDALTYIIEARRSSRIVLVIFNIFAYSVVDLCLVSFSFFMFAIICRTKRISCSFLYIVIAICSINVISILIGSYSGDFFTVTDGQIQYGSWKYLVTVMPIAAVIVLLIVLIMHIRTVGTRDTLVLGSFVAFPLVASIIVIFSPELQLSYMAAALSCSLIFTFIRREEINEAQIREAIMQQVSSHDTLTGLMNRRGFDDAVGLAAEHERLGVAFCDLNALKYTNDNFGHAAGDASIRRFADLLREVFGDKGSLCRISGDEFVVLLYDICENDLNELKKKMNTAIMKNDRMASVGYAYGRSGAVLELIRSAEREMYEDKNRFYMETGIDRRRSAKFTDT